MPLADSSPSTVPLRCDAAVPLLRPSLTKAVIAFVMPADRRPNLQPPTFIAWNSSNTDIADVRHKFRDICVL